MRASSLRFSPPPWMTVPLYSSTDPALHNCLHALVAAGLTAQFPFMAARYDVRGTVFLGEIRDGRDFVALGLDPFGNDASCIVAAPYEPVAMQRLCALFGQDGW